MLLKTENCTNLIFVSNHLVGIASYFKIKSNESDKYGLCKQMYAVTLQYFLKTWRT